MTFNPLAHSITRDSVDCIKDNHLVGSLFTSDVEYIYVVLQERNIDTQALPTDNKFYEILEIRQVPSGESLVLLDIFEANLTTWRLESEYDYEQEEFYRKVKLFCFLYNNEKICFISKDESDGVETFFTALSRDGDHG